MRTFSSRVSQPALRAIHPLEAESAPPIHPGLAGGVGWLSRGYQQQTIDLLNYWSSLFINYY
jgi:hypothetical protein